MGFCRLYRWNMKRIILILSLLISVAYAQRPIINGWKYATCGNNGTITGASWSADVPTQHSANVNSLSFVSGDKVLATSNISLGGTGTSGAISIWVKVVTFNRVFVTHTTSFDYVSVVNSTTIDVNIGNVSSQSFTVPTMSTGTWYNIIVNRNAGSVRLYLDGTESTTGAVTLTGTWTLNQLGVYESGGGAFNWDGKISEFRAFNTSLSSTDISNLAAGSAPVTSSFLRWKINEGTGTNVICYTN